MQSELTTALAATRQAARVCSASQALVCRQLQSDFPGDPVIGEEGAEELRSGEAAFLQRIVDECKNVGTAASGDVWVSSETSSICRPRTPPASFTWSTTPAIASRMDGP